MIILDIFTLFPEHFPIFKTVLSGCVAFFLGLLWYHPAVLGEKWSFGINGDSFERQSPPFWVYIVALLLWMVSAGVYSFLTNFLTPPTMGELFGLSTFLWVGFILPAIMMNGLFAGKKLSLMGVDASYFLAGLYLFAVIHDVL